MDLPTSLPGRAYLLAVDPEKERLRSKGELGRALRAAALEQLTLAGRLTDDGGRPRATGGPVDDPLADAVLEQIRDSKPRKWKYWVGKDERKARTVVRDALVAAGTIRVEPHRLLGVVPDDVVKLRDPRSVKELRTRTRRALTGSEPVSRMEPDAVALAAIAALGKFGTVSGWRERFAARGRTKQLIAAGGPALLALKKSYDEQDAGSAAGAA